MGRQRANLIGEGTFISFRDDHLTLADPVHQFNSCQAIAGRTERFETRYRFRDPLLRTVILLNNVVEILDLTNGGFEMQRNGQRLHALVISNPRKIIVQPKDCLIRDPWPLVQRSNDYWCLENTFQLAGLDPL